MPLYHTTVYVNGEECNYTGVYSGAIDAAETSALKALGDTGALDEGEVEVEVVEVSTKRTWNGTVRVDVITMLSGEFD